MHLFVERKDEKNLENVELEETIKPILNLGRLFLVQLPIKNVHPSTEGSVMVLNVVNNG